MDAGVLPAICTLAGGAAWAAASLRGTGLPRGERTLLAAALAPGLGFGALSIVHYLGLLAGIARPGHGLYAVVATALTLAILSLAILGLCQAKSPGRAPSSWTRSDAVCAIAAALSASLAVYAFSRELDVYPDGQFDAIAIWNVRARFLFHLGASHREQLPFLARSHSDYPLAIPGAVAAQFAALGAVERSAQVSTATAFFLGAPLLVFAIVKSLTRPAIAAAAALVILTTPYWIERSAAQEADVPLAYFAAGAALGLATLLHPDPSRRLPASLVGFFLGMLGWTKDEGLLLALLLGALFAAFASRRTIAAVVGGAIVPLLTVGIFKVTWAPHNDALSAGTAWDAIGRAAELGRWKSALTGVASILTEVPRWGLVWPLVGAVALLAWRRRLLLDNRWLRYLTIAALASGAAYVSVYVLTPAPQAWHIETSARRLLLQLLPWVASLAFLALGTGVTPQSHRSLHSEGLREA